jgi:hypothetical protein
VAGFWPGGKASVILLPGGEQGHAVLERAAEWTEMGLLGPALWVLPEHVTIPAAGPAVVGATVLGIGRAQERVELSADLFETLAREELRLVRMIKLRAASASRERDAEQDAIADAVSATLSQSMPMAMPTTNVADRATDLARVTLICAPSEFQLRERVDWAVHDSGTVVVASPEDRSSPWSGDAFVRDNERFVGFVLMHLASVAGLWSGVDKGTFELFPTQASGLGSVWVSRVFVNAVLTESLGRRTAADVLDEAGRADSLLIDPSVGAPPEGTFYIEDGDVPAFVASMVEAVLTLDGAALAFHPPADVPDPPRRRIGIGAQLGSFLSFSADKLAGMPRWTWRWVTSGAARSLTRRLHGDDGTHVVGEDLDRAFDLRDRLLLSERERVIESERAARAMLAGPAGVGQQRTTPRLWKRLRELVFGALDGSSDLSELGFAEVEGKVPVFGRVSDVFEAPDQLWSPPAGSATRQPIGWHDLALEDPRAALAQAAVRSAGAHEQAEAQLTLARRRLAELEHQREVGEWQSVLDGSIAIAIAAAEAGEGEPAAARTDDPAFVASGAAGADGDATSGVAAKSEAPLTRAARKAEAEAEAALEPRAGAGVADADSAERGDELGGAGGQVSESQAADSGKPAAPMPGAPKAAKGKKARKAAAPAGGQPPRYVDPALTASIDAAQERVLAAEAHSAERAAGRVAAEAAIESFDVWALRHERSFVWRLLSRLALERRGAQESAEHFARGLDALGVQQPGALIGLRKRFHLTMLVGWLIVIAVAALLILLPVWITGLREQVPWYPSDPTIFSVAAGAAILLTLIALAGYHRGWSQFQRRIDLAQAQLTRVAQGSMHARGEISRLASLHRQTVDWLVLLARGIHRPWFVPEEWKQRPGYGGARDAMPFAMQIGQVQDEDHASATRLKRMTKERLVVRGWRQQAFSALIAEVAAELGQTSASFGIAALDEDLPHSSNHTREMLRENMGSEAVLQRVAGPRLRELMATIQRSALHGSRPLVHPIGENPLRRIAAVDIVGGASSDLPWDDFLLGSLAGRRDPVTPLSAVSMSERHVQEGYHEHVRSLLVLPERLEPDLEFRADAPVSLIPYGGGGSASLDLVWRVDLAGPLPVSAIRLWDPAARHAADEGAARGATPASGGRGEDSGV